ncbi:hypothetical protein K227x_49440 [Rubripirellula lacrimiformis]|uniref:Uncharacterized protein n=1 Tax=Rubripirellula lacrimiformis TaxID=1930273 RepID=A0A517NHB8_9BACT|nr:hypothetical protein [Rubripirellula lacrimiformis]QDT06534.1 hypothetical protein K227x_49440 [Rubripirellula lacrimiformis]
MSNRNRNVFKIVTITIMVTGLAYIGIEAKRWIDPHDGRDFDRLVWEADPGGYERAAMCTDIIDRHLQPNMTLDQISDLLGDSFTDRDRSHFQDGGQMPGVRTIAYWVGPCSWIGYDDAFLFVNLDENNQLVSASVYGY